MFGIKTVIFLGLLICVNASLSGPFLFWGHKQVMQLQANTLLEPSHTDLTLLYKTVKAIAIFVRNSSSPLGNENFVEFRNLVEKSPWAYLPQHALLKEPFEINKNLSVFNLNGPYTEQDHNIVTEFKKLEAKYGAGEVLGILASNEYPSHHVHKRQAQQAESENEAATTASPSSTADETEEGFIYVADGKKAILYVNSAPLLNLSNSKETLKLVEHSKAITFDDQKNKGYGRLNIIFTLEGEKLFLRFNFTLFKGTWSMKAVEVEYQQNKTVLPIVGNMYTAPYAPVGFSYRCNSVPMVFRNGNESLVINDYQIQPWLNGADKFGDVYYCVGFVTSGILSGIVVTTILGIILTIALLMILDIKPPTRFESTRSKQLTIDVHE